MRQMSRVQTQATTRLGNKNVNGVKNTHTGMVFHSNMEPEYVPGMVRATGEIIRGATHQWTTGDAPEVVQILLQEDMVRFNKRLRKKQETSDKWG